MIVHYCAVGEKPCFPVSLKLGSHMQILGWGPLNMLDSQMWDIPFNEGQKFNIYIKVVQVP